MDHTTTARPGAIAIFFQGNPCIVFGFLINAFRPVCQKNAGAAVVVEDKRTERVGPGKATVSIQSRIILDWLAAM